MPHFAQPWAVAGKAQQASEASGQAPRLRWYLPVRARFSLAHLLAQPWIHDFSTTVGPEVACLAIYGVALIAGFSNAFLALSQLLDRRPQFLTSIAVHDLWAITLLLAACNADQGRVVRPHPIGFVVYAWFYSIILQPACVCGCVHEVVRRTWNWGAERVSARTLSAGVSRDCCQRAAMTRRWIGRGAGP